MYDSYLRSAPFRLIAVKHCIFRKSAAALIAFRLKACKSMPSLLGMALFRTGYCPSYIEGGVLSSINDLNSICRFGQFVLHLSVLLYL